MAHFANLQNEESMTNNQRANERTYNFNEESKMGAERRQRERPEDPHNPRYHLPRKTTILNIKKIKETM